MDVNAGNVVRGKCPHRADRWRAKRFKRVAKEI